MNAALYGITDDSRESVYDLVAPALSDARPSDLLSAILEKPEILEGAKIELLRFLDAALIPHCPDMISTESFIFASKSI